MARVSIVIPSRVETYEVSAGVSVLQRTVQDIYKKATGDFEVIVAFDGPPYQSFPDYPNLIKMQNEWQGTKPTVNAAVNIATGKYIFKSDSHCMFAEGFDEILQMNMEDNWVVTPRMYILDAENWKWQDERFYDYFRLPCPFNYKRGFLFQAGGHWPERTAERLDIPIDENMKLHGSAWFMNRDYYLDCLGGIISDGSGTWNGEDIDITMRTWLGSWNGKLMVNKNTWYAHMHRGGQRPRGYGFSHNEAYASARWSAKYWMSNLWDARVHDIEWLIDRFSPIPGWPENWKELYKDWKNEQTN
jgi:glycosyltransferase involved in cell wall biosynthesis